MSVSTNEDIIIKDSCILFDLLDLDLMDHFFKLPIRVYTTVQVIDEVQEDHQKNAVDKYVSGGHISVDRDGTLETISDILTNAPGLSFTDSSVLELAYRLQGVVLSADKSLRKESVKRNLTVRGMLWVIEEMCSKNIITTEVAIEKLNLYPQVNDRAPKIEIVALIEKIQSKT